jgi:ATP-dependent RNA helicase DeaD
VQELAEQSGRDIAEIAASAAWLARGDRPLLSAAEAEPAAALPPEEGMVRLFIDAGRKSGIRPNDIVGAIANEAGMPGRAIGAIDIYDRFTFVEVPSEYKEQVLTAMEGVKIRNQAVNVRVATPRPGAPGAPDMSDRAGQESARRQAKRLPPRRRTPGRDGPPWQTGRKARPS